MKIAAAYNKHNGEIAGELEQSLFFRIYDIENNRIICSEVVGTMGSGLADFLVMFEIDGLLCGNCSIETEALLYDEGIQVFSGRSGECDEEVEKLLKGNIDQ